jgi:PAS domain S-box-containing protein
MEQSSMSLSDPGRIRVLAEVWDDPQTAACVFGLDGRYLDVNDRWCQFFGYTRDEMLAMRAGDLTVDVGRSGQEMFQEILEQGQLTAQGVARRKDGSQVRLRFRASRRRVGGTDLILVAVWAI